MYCKYCGAKLEDNTRFCTSCGAERQGNAPSGFYGASVNRPPQGGFAPVPAAALPRKKKRSVIAIAIAILVILLGVQSMSLSIVGKTTDAVVTDARQDQKSYGETMPDPNRYRVQYAFSVGGEPYAGSASLIFRHGIRENQKIKVRYLSFYPAINAPTEDTKILGGMLLTGLGTLLLVLGVNGKIRIGGRPRERSALSDDGRRL